MSAPALKTVLDSANPNTLADGLRVLHFGGILRSSITTQLRQATPVAGGVSNGNLATEQVFVLPGDATGATILRAYARKTTAAGTLGELAPQAFGATPADGQIAVAPNGNIVVLAASAYTNIDVDYLPMKGDVIQYTGSVAVGVLALPAALVARGVITLLSAVVNAGAVPGGKIVLVPAAGLPATTQARLDVAKANVSFNNATDAPTNATVTLLVTSAADVNALLEATSPIM
jgi:hypothetical protein